MIGVIHQLFFGFVEKTFGPTAVTDVKRRAGVSDREYRMDSIYPDDEWQRIVGSAVELSKLSAEQAELAFARYCGEELSVRMAGFFKGCTTTRQFLTQQPIIHNMMASSVRDAAARRQIADKFRLEDANGETVTHYASPNRHCALYRGLADWVASYYKERIEIAEPRCQKRGDDECEIRVKYLGKA